MELAAAFLYHYFHRVEVSYRIFNILEGVDHLDLDADETIVDPLIDGALFIARWAGRAVTDSPA